MTIFCCVSAHIYGRMQVKLARLLILAGLSMSRDWLLLVNHSLAWACSHDRCKVLRDKTEAPRSRGQGQELPHSQSATFYWPKQVTAINLTHQLSVSFYISGCAFSHFNLKRKNAVKLSRGRYSTYNAHGYLLGFSTSTKARSEQLY